MIKAIVKLQPCGEGDALLELPPNICEFAGIKDDDLVEIIPMARSVGGHVIEHTITIRKLRH